MRPPQGVQRGSVYNGNGDPSTPGWPSKPGAKRLAVDKLDVPRIPVVPIGYGNASELLRGLNGARIPQTWQGGLPFRYHIGPGPVAAHLVDQGGGEPPDQRIFGAEQTLMGKSLLDVIGSPLGDDHFGTHVGRAAQRACDSVVMPVRLRGADESRRVGTMAARIATCGPPRAALVTVEPSEFGRH